MLVSSKKNDESESLGGLLSLYMKIKINLLKMDDNRV